MLLKEKKLSYEVLLKTLILPTPNWNRKLNKSLENLPIPYLEKLITCLVRGEEIPELKEAKRLAIFKTDVPWQKIALFREITRVKTRLVSSENVIRSLTDRILTDLLPSFPDSFKHVDMYQTSSFSEKDWGYFMFYEMVKT